MFVGITSSEPDLQPVQFPIIDELSGEFGLMVGNINKTILGLSTADLQRLIKAISAKLFQTVLGLSNTGIPAKWKPEFEVLESHRFVPSTAEELMRTLSNCWDFLNFEFAQLVVNFLKDERLQRQMLDYEENVRRRIELVIQDCIRNSVLPEPLQMLPCL